MGPNAITNESFMRKYIEPSIYTIALLLLYFMNASKDSFSFCVFKLVGFNSCLSCGVGHAVHHALHFNFQQSFQAHALGVPLTIGILLHILHLLTNKNQNHHTWISNKC